MAIAGNTKPSMLQDLEQGRLTEVDVVNGGVAQRAREHRIATPFNDRVVELVHAMERGERSPAPRGADRAASASRGDDGFRQRKDGEVRGVAFKGNNVRVERHASSTSIRITAATAVAVAIAAIGAPGGAGRDGVRARRRAGQRRRPERHRALRRRRHPEGHAGG